MSKASAPYYKKKGLNTYHWEKGCSRNRDPNDNYLV